MNARMTYVIGPLIALALAGIFAAWWFDTMEKKWDTQRYDSDVASKNPMLAAQRLLSKHRYAVQLEETMSSYLLRPAMPRGTVILAENEGVMNRPQVEQLLAWVARGNNLILTPTWHAPKRTSVDNDDLRDDVGAHFGISLQSGYKEHEVCRSDTESEQEQRKRLQKDDVLVDCSANITLPDADYALHLEPSRRIWWCKGIAGKCCSMMTKARRCVPLRMARDVWSLLRRTILPTMICKVTITLNCCWA